MIPIKWFNSVTIRKLQIDNPITAGLRIQTIIRRSDESGPTYVENGFLSELDQHRISMSEVRGKINDIHHEHIERIYRLMLWKDEEKT